MAMHMALRAPVQLFSRVILQVGLLYQTVSLQQNLTHKTAFNEVSPFIEPPIFFEENIMSDPA